MVDESPRKATEEPARNGASRRSFLKLGLLGAGGVVVGLPVVRVGMWWNRRPGEGLRALSEHEFHILEAMAEAILPPGGIIEESGKELNLATFVDEQLARLNPDLRRVLKAGLHAIEDLTIFEDWGVTPFSKRPLAEREAILQSWERSPVLPKRSLVRVYKWYLCMGLCELPGMLERLGVDYLCDLG